eukprot:CAMPEP_0197614126 /NCGR_PEP_ID=MMETSP1326-20131121/59368_1 /TAXON_ID=1155430 /ORGANISM="Genus nov. species nov., Strain RCC2288" /LENGTH=176 /DNA_ID=CAMNT_0043182995 /DNA_START=1204 /DNA_END=1735 /DNA_ORIENTATION=+
MLLAKKCGVMRFNAKFRNSQSLVQMACQSSSHRVSGVRGVGLRDSSESVNRGVRFSAAGTPDVAPRLDMIGAALSISSSDETATTAADDVVHVSEGFAPRAVQHDFGLGALPPETTDLPVLHAAYQLHQASVPIWAHQILGGIVQQRVPVPRELRKASFTAPKSWQNSLENRPLSR